MPDGQDVEGASIMAWVGLTPRAATSQVERSGNEPSPGVLIMAATMVALAAAMRFQETYRKPASGS